MSRRLTVCLTGALLCLLLLGGGRGVHAVPTVQTVVVLPEGLFPVAMAAAPDGRVFVSIRSGEVRILENGLLSAPILQEAVIADSHRGMLGLALHPDFAANGLLYVYFTDQMSGRNVIDRYQVAPSGSIVPGSRTRIFDTGIVSPQSNIGGALAFGSDGMLYVAIGDHCAPSNEDCRKFSYDPTDECPGLGPWCNAAPQTIADIRGKILRLDPNATPSCAAAALCGVPAPGNPFATNPSAAAQLVYAYGFRNVFGLTVHPTTNELWAVDNGSILWDEANRVQAGRNYGWPIYEGRVGPTQVGSYTNPPLQDSGSYREPVAVLENNGATQPVFNRSTAPAILGQHDLLICSYLTGVMHRINPANGVVIDEPIAGDCKLALMRTAVGQILFSRQLSATRWAIATACDLTAGVAPCWRLGALFQRQAGGW